MDSQQWFKTLNKEMIDCKVLILEGSGEHARCINGDNEISFTCYG